MNNTSTNTAEADTNKKRLKISSFRSPAKTYSIEEPSTDDNQAVKSAPQAALVASATIQDTGDDSISAAIEESQ